MIKELTLRVTDLEKKAIAFCREKDVTFPIANYLVDFATEVTKELQEELNYAESHCLFHSDCPTQKENAELKAQLESERDLPAIAYQQGAEKQKKKDEEELQKWKDEWQEQVQKATDEGYARTLQTMQLSKAKEIIRELIHEISVFYIATDKTIISPTVKDAEQFLSEVEKNDKRS